MVMDSKDSLFFCDSKVIVTVSAWWRLGSEWSKRRPLRRKVMLRTQSNLVLRSSLEEVDEYSQERMAKNQAPVASWWTARFSSSWECFRSSRRTLGGIAFWRQTCLSWTLYPLYCCRRIGLVRPSMSSLGSYP